jgi:Suv3 C-terminal domain 1
MPCFLGSFQGLEQGESFVFGMSESHELHAVQFDLEAQQEDLYFLCNQSSLLAIARALDDIPALTLAERHQLCCAPVDEKNTQAFDAFVNFVRWSALPPPHNTHIPSNISVCWLQLSRTVLPCTECACTASPALYRVLFRNWGVKQMNSCQAHANISGSAAGMQRRS